MKHVVLVLGIALILGAPLAWGDDDESDEPFAGKGKKSAGERAGDLYRRAQVAETVEHDIEKAIRLYREAMKQGDGKTQGAALAGQRLAQVFEDLKRTSDALDVLRVMTERHSEILTDGGKRAIHEAILRLLPPGGRARTPLGEIYVAPGSIQVETSPLDRKVREMLQVLDGAGRQVWSSLEYGLNSVGEDALPVFRDIMLNDSPKRANFAAQMYAKFGQARALDGLGEAIRKGDGFARAAAISALNQIKHGEETSPAFIAMVDRLIEENVAPDKHATLRYQLYRHLDDEELMRRYAEDEAHATSWLGKALDRKVSGALEAALDLAAKGGEPGREMIVKLVSLALPARGRPAIYPAETLESATAAQFLYVLARDPDDLTETSAEALVRLLRVIEGQADSPASAQARERVWRRIPAYDPRGGNNNQDPLTQALLRGSQPILPTAALFRDRDWSRRFFGHISRARPPGDVLLRLEQAGEDFWLAFFDALAHHEPNTVSSLRRLLPGLYPRHDKFPPRAYDARWIDVLAGYEGRGVPETVSVRAAARSGDPRFLDLFRRHVLPITEQSRASLWLQALQHYDGPGRLALLEEMLSAPAGQTFNITSQLFYLLAMDKSPEARALVMRLASDWKHPLAQTAVGVLSNFGASEMVIELCERLRTSQDEVPVAYRSAVIREAQALHLRGAIPYLVHEYKLGHLAKPAATAMDEIRAYHERLAAFEAFARAGSSAPASKTSKLVDLLADSDPEIRRAAVMALGALGRRDALEQIVVLAKEDADGSVRQAALEAVERMAGAGRGD